MWYALKLFALKLLALKLPAIVAQGLPRPHLGKHTREHDHGIGCLAEVSKEPWEDKRENSLSEVLHKGRTSIHLLFNLFQVQTQFLFPGQCKQQRSPLAFQTVLPFQLHHRIQLHLRLLARLGRTVELRHERRHCGEVAVEVPSFQRVGCLAALGEGKAHEHPP